MRQALSFFVTLLALSLGVHAEAGPLLDFALGARASTVVQFGVIDQTLTATDVRVIEVQGKDTPLNDFVSLTITNGRLDFKTGVTTGTTGSGASEIRSFGAGTASSITIVGDVGNGLETLLDGQIRGAALQSSATSPNTIKLVTSIFVNGIADELADYFGLPRSLPPGSGSTPYSGLIESFSLTLPGSGLPASFVAAGADVGSGNLTTTPVPEPGNLVMAILAMPLVGLGYRHLRRKSHT